LIVGDATELGTLAAPPGYSLIYDLGCIQGLPDEAAALAAKGITSLAGEDVTLLVVAFARGRRMILPRGMDRDQMEALFGPYWRLVGTHDLLQLSDHRYRRQSARQGRRPITWSRRRPETPGNSQSGDATNL
jgi:hypothetical protein